MDEHWGWGILGLAIAGIWLFAIISLLVSAINSWPELTFLHWYGLGMVAFIGAVALSLYLKRIRRKT